VRAKEIQKEFSKFRKRRLHRARSDLVSLSVVDELEQLAPVLVVYGNMDGPEVRGKLPKMSSFKIFEWKIGVTHYPGARFGAEDCVKSPRPTALTFSFMAHS